MIRGQKGKSGILLFMIHKQAANPTAAAVSRPTGSPITRSGSSDGQLSRHASRCSTLVITKIFSGWHQALQPIHRLGKHGRISPQSAKGASDALIYFVARNAHRARQP